MPKATAVADSFAIRVIALLKKQGNRRSWFHARLEAADVRISKPTVYELLDVERPGWPVKRGGNFFLKVADILKCELDDLAPHEVLRDLFPSPLSKQNQPGEENMIRHGSDEWRFGQSSTGSDSQAAMLLAIARMSDHLEAIREAAAIYFASVDKSSKRAQGDLAEFRAILDPKKKVPGRS